jgi:hypothetical protein
MGVGIPADRPKGTWSRVHGWKRLKMYRSTDLGLRHHFWWLFGQKEFWLQRVEILHVAREGACGVWWQWVFHISVDLDLLDLILVLVFQMELR